MEISGSDDERGETKDARYEGGICWRLIPVADDFRNAVDNIERRNPGILKGELS